MVAVTSNLGRYRRLSVLGSGGMATVELAEDTVLGRKVALKRVKAEGDVRGLARLRREALAGASISHPNLIAIYDVVTTDQGDVVIVMEYVPGETLADRLARDDRLAIPEALRILAGVAAGLDAIHRRGIVHRDVKPANVLLGPGGEVKLADLGIALVPERTQLTTDGAVMGSFRYMAAEQLEGAAASPAIDIYALAAVAYEVLSGRRARSEVNPLALAHAIDRRPPPDLRTAWPQAPAAAAELLIRGMSRDPANRPRAAGELVGDLRAALEPAPTARMPAAAAVPARPTAVPARPAKPARPTAVPARPALISAGPADLLGARSDPSAGRPWLGLLAAAALVAVAVIAVVATLASGGSGSSPPKRAAATRRAGATARRRRARVAPAATSPRHAAVAPAGTPATTAPGTPPPKATGAGSPTAAVESFYGLAAAHRYASAWALADPAFRSQLAGYDSFQAGQAGDRSITFDYAHVVRRSANAATVAVRTTSVRTDGTKHCAGSVELVSGTAANAWLLHQIAINCV